MWERGRPRRQASSVNAARERGGDGKGLRTEGKLRRVEWSPGGVSARRQNRANPRAGSVLQDTRRSAEEEPVEGVRNPEGGTRSGGGRPFPKEVATRPPGVDSVEVFPGGGANLWTVQEKGVVGSSGNGTTVRVPAGDRTGAGKRGRSWNDGRKARRGGSEILRRMELRRGEGPREVGVLRANVDAEACGGRQEEPDSASCPR